jgi:outer membrane protein OmpA-like peptidoglycan-associated protein
MLAAPLALSTFAQDAASSTPIDTKGLYQVNVIPRTVTSVNYRDHSGSTKVNFQGTDLMLQAKGTAKVESKAGRLAIGVDLEGLTPATNFGPQYLTYVLWAITPDGRPNNLGEILLTSDGKASTKVTTDLQAFGLIVTAEPYFAVVRPTNLVIVENVVRADTKGWQTPIAAKFEVLDKGEYTIDIPAGQLPATAELGSKVPLDLLEARNAVAIARAAGAQKYAPEAFAKAVDFLARGEDYLQRKQGAGPIGTVARGATESAEDARLLTIQKKKQEQIAAAQAAADARAAQAKAEAAASAARAQAAQQAELQSQEARANAEAARAAALEQQLKAQAEAQKAQQAEQQARQAALQAEQAKEAMRSRLLAQLNAVLQTQDSPRGLIVHMSDVLFASGQATLKEPTREALARLSGIISAYPGLRLAIEGHTDNVGGAEFNMTLSQKRASNVRDFLLSQGLPPANVTAQGFGMADPVATNDTAAGRQQNRRVDIVVSGEAIGTQIGAPAGGASAAPATPAPAAPQP